MQYGAKVHQLLLLLILFGIITLHRLENTLLMSVLKDKMFVRFEFEDGQTINETEYLTINVG